MTIDTINKLPEKTGVYLFKDTEKKIIYVGKAKNLKKRVSSYFSKNHADAKTNALVNAVKSLDYIVTANEVEALILEANLIKKHKPHFNIDLKDNKTYPFIKVTLYEDFPRVIKTRKFTNDGSKYFGPYTNVNVIYRGLEIIQRLFKIRTCNKKIKAGAKIKPCLNYQIGRCMGVCTGDVSKEEYAKVLDDVMVFLSGKFDKLIKKLDDKMKQASEKLEFEKAVFFRDQLEYVKNINQSQKVYTPDKKDRDVIGFYKQMNKYYFTVLFFREGKLLGKRAFSSKVKENETRALTSFLAQYYEENHVPDEIFLPHEIEDFFLVVSMLNEKNNAKLFYPKKGIKKRMLDMANNNARYEFLKDKKLSEKEAALVDLKNALEIKNLPRRIECFDISNTDGILAVGSMVSFFNGRADKKNYRTFKIKTVQGPDDYGMMRETVSRRYTRVINEGLVKPDLIVIDGGKGQVNAAYDILVTLGLEDIPVIGLAKKKETVIFPGACDSLSLNHTHEGLRLLVKIRDEAHRFGISFHKKLRSKKMRFSILDEINGIGHKKRNLLMKHFKSIKELSVAEIDVIKLSGVDIKSAQAVYDFFHSE